MKKENMKVFHGLVNYGTQAGMLAKGLRDEGIKAISVVSADTMKRLVDINMRYDLNQKSAVLRTLQRMWIRFSSFFKYNVFHFYFGKSLWPFNMDLPLYKLFRKKVVMEYLGTDVDLWLGYNGVDWRGRKIDRVKLVRRVYRQARQVNIQLVCNPQLKQFVDNSVFLPLALDLDSYCYQPRKYDYNNLVIMHCPTNRKAKRSDIIEEAIERLKSEGYNFQYKCVQNVSHSRLKEEYISSDIVIDQLNTWYGTVGIEAMALGRPVICTCLSHLTWYDDRLTNLPIINADISNIYSVLKSVLEGKYDLESIGKSSRDFVMRVHDVKSVTKQLLGIYESL